MRARDPQARIPASGGIYSVSGLPSLRSIVAGGAGYLVGVPLGVVVVGRLRKQRGSAWLALIASLLAGALVVALAEPLRLNTVPSLLQAVFVGFPALASAWAFAARVGQYRAS